MIIAEIIFSSVLSVIGIYALVNLVKCILEDRRIRREKSND